MLSLKRSLPNYSLTYPVLFSLIHPYLPPPLQQPHLHRGAALSGAIQDSNQRHLHPTGHDWACYLATHRREDLAAARLVCQGLGVDLRSGGIRAGALNVRYQEERDVPPGARGKYLGMDCVMAVALIDGSTISGTGVAWVIVVAVVHKRVTVGLGKRNNDAEHTPLACFLRSIIEFYWYRRCM